MMEIIVFEELISWEEEEEETTVTEGDEGEATVLMVMIDQRTRLVIKVLIPYRG